MKMPQMIAAEFRRLFSTKMSVIALIALLCVPILYGGLYLWANQDPYSNLTNVPVALVVNDNGAEVNGKQRDIGDEVAKELLDSDTFDWHRVSAAEAESGLDAGAYDFTVEIPADFTEGIASIATDDPHPADLVLRTNDANNYLASTIGKTAIETIQRTVTEKVVSEAGLTMLDALHEIRTKLVDATDGATQLVDGLVTAQDGTSKLGDGAQQLVDGSQALADGATTLADGASQVASGSASVRDGAGTLADGTVQLRDGLATLADGASQVAGGTGQLADIADQIGDAAQNAADQLPAVREDIRTRLTEQGLTADQIDRVLAALDPVGTELTNAVDKVQGARDKIDTLNSGAVQVADGASQLHDGAVTAADGAAALRDGASQVADGASQVSTGAATLRDGTVTLHTGTVTLKDGVGTLADGLAQLHDGEVTLRDGLAAGVEQIPNSDDATRSAQAHTLGAPVQIAKTTLTQAQNYGAGLAPFFAALAAWIGIYALFLIVKPISRRAVTALHSPVRVTLAGWATPALLGAVQMVGLFAVLSITLGFNFANPAAALGLLVLASATYTAIILALNVWLGSVGQFMGLILMVLQLVTAGGTFPWQTLPAPLASLHHILPMGYVVDAMRQIMYGSGGWDRVWSDIGVLLMWLIGAVVLAILGVSRMTRRRTMRDLAPSLIG